MMLFSNMIDVDFDLLSTYYPSLILNELNFNEIKKINF